MKCHVNRGISLLCSKNSYLFIAIFPPCYAATKRWSWPPHFRGFYITHNDTPQSVGLLWTRFQHVAVYQKHTTLRADKYPCPWRDSKPQFQQASGRRPKPQTVLPLGSLFRYYQGDKIERIKWAGSIVENPKSKRPLQRDKI